MDDYVQTSPPFHPQAYDWTPLLSATGVFLHTYLRDLAAHQRTLRPFVLTPALPTRAALPALLGLAEPWQVAGLEYLLTSAGLLQGTETDAFTVLPQPALAWPVLDQVLTALLPALAPEHPDHAAAHAAVRVLAQAGLVQDTEPAHLFDVDGAWPDLLPLLLDDERWQHVFTHLHGTEACVSYTAHADAWVVDAWRERARRDQAQVELAAYLLAAQRPEEPGGNDPHADGGSGTPGSGADGPDDQADPSALPPVPVADHHEATRASLADHLSVAGDHDPGATSPMVSLADRQGVALGSPLRATLHVARLQEPPILLSLPDAPVSLRDRSLMGDSLTTPDSLNDPITTTTHESPSDTTSDMRSLIERHLRAEELASTRLDAAFWCAVNRILTGSDTRYPHTAGEKKAAERQFKRRQIPIGVVLMALRAIMSLPNPPRTFGEAITRDTFPASVEAALALVPPPSDGRDWCAFLHTYRQIGRVDGLRDVRPADYTALQGLFTAQPDACWQVLARWTECPPLRVSPSQLRRALTAPRARQSTLPWAQPPARRADDPRHALLIGVGLSPRLLTPGMTEDYLHAWIAEADARAAELTNRVGWLTWGMRSGHWPEAHPQLRPRRLAHRPTPPVPPPPADPYPPSRWPGSSCGVPCRRA